MANEHLEGGRVNFFSFVDVDRIALYLAWRSRDFVKCLAGAFFVSSGILFYLYLANVSVPVLGTDFVETPAISGGRCVVHFALFVLCLYFGFLRKPTV